MTDTLMFLLIFFQFARITRNSIESQKLTNAKKWTLIVEQIRLAEITHVAVILDSN